MRRPPLAGFAVSAVAHLIAVGFVILVVTRTASLPPLFIDLTTESAPAYGGRATPPRDARPAVTAARPARPVASSPPPPAAAARPERRAPIVDITDPASSASPAPLRPALAPESPSTASDVATIAPQSEAPVVAQRPADAAPDEVTASSPPSLNAADGSAPSARRASGGGEFVTVADGGPGGGGAGARAGQGLALATPGASALGTPVAAPGAPAGEYAEYLARFRQRIQESLRYPMPARRRGLSGTVHLDVTIQPDGAIEAVTIAQSSSHASLDDAAVGTVRGLRRVPFPKGVMPRILQVRVPVVFALQ